LGKSIPPIISSYYRDKGDAIYKSAGESENNCLRGSYRIKLILYLALDFIA
jgi:hypothetical protein